MRRRVLMIHIYCFYTLEMTNNREQIPTAEVLLSDITANAETPRTAL